MIPTSLVIKQDAQIVQKRPKDLVIDLFGESKLAVVTSFNTKNWLKIAEENTLELNLEIGEEVLIEDCQVVIINKERLYRVKIYGLRLKSDRFGFERYFPHYFFTPKSSSRQVLQGMGIKFNHNGEMMSWTTKI